MKTKLIFCFFLFFAFVVSAQAEVKKVILGGYINAQQLKNFDNDESKTYSINPTIGIKYSVKSELGLAIGYSYNEDLITPLFFYDEFFDYENIRNTNYLFQPYYKRFFNLSDNFQFILTSSLRLEWGSHENLLSTDSDYFSMNSFGYGASITPGLAYQVTDLFRLELNTGSLGYFIRDFEHTSENLIANHNSFDYKNSESYGFSFALSSVNLGLLITL